MFYFLKIAADPIKTSTQLNEQIKLRLAIIKSELERIKSGQREGTF